MPNTVVDAQGIWKSYGSRRVLEGLDLRVQEGTIVALLGPNGAGKTTLVRILSTLTRLDRGTATICGHDVVREPQAVRASISLTGQYAALDELLTGEENLRLVSRLWRLEPHIGRQRAHDLIQRFELGDAARNPVKTYSGGMKRKLDLAMGLMGTPRVLFLDEPTTGLDPRSRNALWETVRELRASGITILLTTQYLEEADQLADRIMMIDHGRVIAEGAPDELKRRTGNDVLILTFPDHKTTIHATLALKDETTLPATGQSSIRVITDGSSSHLYSVLARLNDVSIAADSVDVQKPTLDDVFLSVTARPDAIAQETHA